MPDTLRDISPAFEARIRAQLGAEADLFLRALDAPYAAALRLNALRAFTDARLPFETLGPVPWCPEGRYLNEETRAGAYPQHALGGYYIQEAGAMSAAAVLNAQPGETVLDLCAAPGGKSTQIAAAMMGRGTLVSNEPVLSRAKVLRDNLSRMGAVNAVVTCAMPDALAARWPGTFDAIAVDAPCSGEGMFRREPRSRGEWTPGAAAGCAARQAAILDSAAAMLRPGGRLVYSTCTFAPEENEQTVEAFLRRHPQFMPEPFELAGAGRAPQGHLTLWPHRVRADGHFVAKLRKASADAPRRRATPDARADEAARALCRQLEAQICALPETLRGGRAVLQGDAVHVLPEGAPPLNGIRTLKTGLYALRAGRSHIQPSDELARACGPAGRAHLARPARTLEADEALMERLLRGEKPKLTGPEKGFALALWRDLPIRFIKLQ